MHTEAIQHTTQPAFSNLATLLKRIRHLFTGYSSKSVNMPSRGSRQQGDLLRNMPIEEKLRLGMYRYMD